MSMNIWAGKGDKVRFVNPNAGSDHDIERAKLFLTLGEEYEVDFIEVQSSSSDMFIKGFPQRFNPVMFEDVSVNEQKAGLRAEKWYGERYGR